MPVPKKRNYVILATLALTVALVVTILSGIGEAAENYISLASSNPGNITISQTDAQTQRISWRSANADLEGYSYSFAILNPSNPRTYINFGKNPPFTLTNYSVTGGNTISADLTVSSTLQWTASQSYNVVVFGYEGDPVTDVNQLPSSDGFYSFTVNLIPASSEQPSVPNDSPISVYRLYNALSTEHLYTPSTLEVEALTENGWEDEGTAWLSDPAESGIPVYRLYSPVTGEHLYTTDSSEVETLVDTGNWTLDFDGDPVFGAPEEGIPVYRLYNEATRMHVLTVDQNEYDTLGEYGWNQEGIAFNAFNS